MNAVSESAVSIGATSSVEQAREQIKEAIRSVDTGDGLLVLTDMFGGTPANLALTFLDEKIEVLTGVNLPMLLKLTTCRSENLPLQATAQVLTTYGQKNITLASELLRTRVHAKRN